jgi:uncharacterized protein YlxW (UPF0749 family)
MYILKKASKENGGKNLKNNNIKVSLLLGIMCFLLTVGIFIQMKTVNDSGTEVAKTTTENELRDSVLSMQEKYEKQCKILENKEKELSNLISNVSANDSTSSELSEELDQVNSKIGLTALKGEGVIITVEDGEVTNSITATQSIVHDKDLISIVNTLCNAGAEAISINGQRIVSTTAITCVGNVIKINDEKIGTPFEIHAIGSKKGLKGALNINGGYVYYMKKEGVIVNIKESDSVIVPRYDGVLKFEYAK